MAKDFQFTRKLDENLVTQLSTLAKKLSTNILTNFELRFSITDGKIVITQLQINNDTTKDASAVPLIEYLRLYKQITPLIAGVKTGPLRRLLSNKDSKKLRRGEIAALKYFDKKLLPTLRKASGLILESSIGVTNEQLAALRLFGKTTLSGQLGELRNKVITIDGRSGKIYYGAFSPPYTKTLAPTSQVTSEIVTKHATALFVKPKTLADFKDLEETTTAGYLFDYKNNIAELIRQVGHQHKTMILQLQSDLVEEGLDLVRALRHKSSLTNLYLCLPTTGTVNEFRALKKLVSASNLHRGGSFKLFCRVATPATALNLADILEEGVDGVVIDYYTLVNKTYGKEFTLSELANLEDKSVQTLLTQIMNLCLRYNSYSLLTNLPSANQTQLLKDAVAKGIKAIAVATDQISMTQELLAKIEKELLTKAE